jgi:DNA-binding MarR family transcriptional regulator
MKDSQVSEMRAFSRFYTALVGVLNRKYLNGRLTLPETRVLQAISMQQGITAQEIVPMLHIDKSYLSKILLRFEKMRFLTRKVSAADGRAYELRLTTAGRKEFEVNNRRSDEFVKQMLLQLPDAECEELVQCMRRVTEILKKVEA